jgi:hypothetical protein
MTALLRFKNISGGCAVVCDGKAHTYSRMSHWAKPEKKFVGLARCWCKDAASDQLARWQEVEA